jgi:hypothetical protein
MSLLRKKSYWITAFIILILSLLKPISIEQSDGRYEYQFGALFPFLSLRLNEFSSGYQDIFSIAAQAYSYELNIVALIGACFVCFLIGCLVIKMIIAVSGKRNLSR